MKIFRNKKNKKLYTIEWLIHDLYHLNANGFTGIYPIPYKHIIKIKPFLNKNLNKCNKYVLTNFDLISEE